MRSVVGKCKALGNPILPEHFTAMGHGLSIKSRGLSSQNTPKLEKRLHQQTNMLGKPSSGIGIFLGSKREKPRSMERQDQ
jgi:hypothetical protein